MRDKSYIWGNKRYSVLGARLIQRFLRGPGEKKKGNTSSVFFSRGRLNKVEFETGARALKESGSQFLGT